MAEITEISWCDHTFNAWVGCTKVSPACNHCYAEGWAKRTGHAELWQGERRRTSASNWRQPLKWNRAAAATGVRRRVFCASLADVFDNQVPEEWRWDLWELIGRTRQLDWLLLTKRPQNIAHMLPVMDSSKPGYKPWNVKWPWPNVWLGTTVENQEEATRRIPHLLEVPAAVHFLSCEPLLGPIDLAALDIRGWAGDPPPKADQPDWRFSALSGAHWFPSDDIYNGDGPPLATLDWVIAGGESGPGARPMHPVWALSLRDQCVAAGIAFHFKQWGEWAPHSVMPGGDLGGDVRAGRVRIVHPTGQSDVEVFRETRGRSTIPGSRYMAKVGKKVAGRLLDGIEHNGYPERQL